MKNALHTIISSSFSKSLHRSLFGRCSDLRRLFAIGLIFSGVAQLSQGQCPLRCDSNGNTAQGNGALPFVTGFFNTAVGNNALFADGSGGENTALGAGALQMNSTGSNNTAVGDIALNSNTASDNTAVGTAALQFNTGGTLNAAVGKFALNGNTTGGNNTAIGANALFVNNFGSGNTAIGTSALSSYNGDATTATGFQALMNNNTGFGNTANGYQALMSNTSGGTNTAVGFGTLTLNISGNSNTATGYDTLLNNTGSSNTAYGHFSMVNNTSGTGNIAVGDLAGNNLTTGNNNIDIGNAGAAGESGTIRIGTSGTQTAAFIAGIRGVPVSGGQPIGIAANGQLGIKASSARFKEAIKPMDKASEAILSLRPVTFRYKKELDPKGQHQFGLVAEEVAKVNPDLVVRDEQGRPFTVRYDEVNAMLLNEFLKEHQEVQALKGQVAELTAGLQKVSAQVELGQNASRLVANHP